MGKLDFLNFEVKAVPEEEGVFEGYASTWERDLIDDEITKGAYAETLSADYPDGGAGIPLYWGHNYDSPLNCIGESLSACEDEKGLNVKFKFDLDTNEGKKAYGLLKRGLVHQMSVASSPRRPLGSRMRATSGRTAASRRSSSSRSQWCPLPATSRPRSPTSRAVAPSPRTTSPSSSRPSSACRMCSRMSAPMTIPMRMSPMRPTRRLMHLPSASLR